MLATFLFISGGLKCWEDQNNYDADNPGSADPKIVRVTRILTGLAFPYTMFGLGTACLAMACEPPIRFKENL